MGKVYQQLDEAHVRFIGRQHVFFVGTAPTSPDGHLNVSPKGLDTFRILGPRSVTDSRSGMHLPADFGPMTTRGRLVSRPSMMTLRARSESAG